MRRPIEPERAEAHRQLASRYADPYWPDFAFESGVGIRVVAVIEPDQLRYAIQRANPRSSTWDIIPLPPFVDREEAITEARKRTNRSRLAHRVVEMFLPEVQIWPSDRPIKENS